MRANKHRKLEAVLLAQPYFGLGEAVETAATRLWLIELTMPTGGVPARYGRTPARAATTDGGIAGADGGGGAKRRSKEVAGLTPTAAAASDSLSCDVLRYTACAWGCEKVGADAATADGGDIWAIGRRASKEGAAHDSGGGRGCPPRDSGSAGAPTPTAARVWVCRSSLLTMGAWEDRLSGVSERPADVAEVPAEGFGGNDGSPFAPACIAMRLRGPPPPQLVLLLFLKEEASWPSFIAAAAEEVDTPPPRRPPERDATETW